MPRAYLMSWEGPPHCRWVKMHKGVRYRVSCADLKAAAWTKEGSGKLANEWWGRKLAELAGPHPRVEAVRQALAEEDDLSRLSREIEALKRERDLLRDEVYNAAHAIADDQGVGVEAVLRALPEADEVKRLSSPLAADAADRSVKALADRWSRDRADEATKGSRSADGANNLRMALNHFVAFAGGPTGVEAIDFDLWRRWHLHCRGETARRDRDGEGGWSAAYARKVFTVARAFVRWLWETEALDRLPRNLGSRQYRFEAEAKAPPCFTDEEVRRFVAAATGQHKLHLLLMLNCGMTQKDVSDLRKDQIDLDAGTITRRRSKTRLKKGTPLVTYPLWPSTLALLRAHLSSDPTIALLTHTGRRWVRKEMRDGRLVKGDSIGSLFQHLRDRLRVTGRDKSLKVFRKTSATRLKSHKDYRDLRFHFLGHAAHNVADRHYAAESPKLLAEAVAWLGREYGIEA